MGQENKELLAFHKEMIRIHKQEKPLRKGSIKLLYAERNVLAYARFQEDEQIIVILNNSKDLKELTVPVWFAGVRSKAGWKGLCIHMRKDIRQSMTSSL